MSGGLLPLKSQKFAQVRIFQEASRKYLGKTKVFRAAIGKIWEKLRILGQRQEIISANQIFCLSRMNSK